MSQGQLYSGVPVRVCRCLLESTIISLCQQAFLASPRHLLRQPPMADYDFRPGGSLKFKGGVAEGGIVKKYVSLVLTIQCT